MIYINIVVLLLLNCCITKQIEFKKIDYIPYKFSDLQNWQNDDHAQALFTFTKSCDRFAPYYKEKDVTIYPKITKVRDWTKICILARQAKSNKAKKFFEDNFDLYLVTANGKTKGLFTGYHVPHLNASRLKSKIYKYPIYKSPKNIDDIKHLLSRKNVNDGILVGRDLELFYTDNEIELFFAQIQGSAKLNLTDNTSVIIGYDKQNGHEYYSIGRYLIDEIGYDKSLINADFIKKVLSNHKNSKYIMELNKSYIFFNIKDDIYGGFGASLTEERSLAIDKKFISYGIPIWLETIYPKIDKNEPKDFHRLMISQDTGGAIKGAVRGDIFFGSTPVAAKYASNMKQQGKYYILLPK